jgi:CubicO group peptidase (beta-lactamase class C family)
MLIQLFWKLFQPKLSAPCFLYLRGEIFMKIERNRFKRFFLRLVVCLCAVQFAMGQTATVTRSSIDTIIEKKMKDSGMVGVGAAIIINKKVVWSKGYGYADRDNKLPFTPNTIMNIASISKTFTGVCLMHAIEDKKLSLDEDINTYLPFKVSNPFFPEEKITLRNLAIHTSGITDNSPTYEKSYSYGGDSAEPLGEFLKGYFVPGGKYYSKDNFLKAKPGSTREYSNIAAALAGYIVETATGTKLNEYSKKYIFKPLRMNDTGWFLSEIKLANHSKLYKTEGGTTKAIKLYGLATYPEGGVRTSIADLSKFFICLLNGGEFNGVRILKNESVREMVKFQFTASAKPENVNLNEINSGIFWATKRNVTRIGHAGNDPGVQAEMLSDLSKEVGVIVFANTEVTTISGERDYKVFFSISDDLWKFAPTLKDTKTAND